MNDLLRLRLFGLFFHVRNLAALDDGMRVVLVALGGLRHVSVLRAGALQVAIWGWVVW